MGVLTDEFVSYVVDLKGQTLSVPDLRPLFSPWPSAMSPHYAEVTRLAEEEYLRLFPNSPKSLAKARGAALPLFASVRHAVGSHALRCKSTWPLYTTRSGSLFLWDDEFDGEDSSLSVILSTPEGAIAIKSQATEYVKFHLGLQDDEAAAAPTPPPFAHMHIFEIVRAERNFRW